MDWKYTLDIKTTLREVEDLEFTEQRKLLAEALRREAQKLPDGDGYGLKSVMADFAECVELCEDIEEVDAVLEEVYDFADAERIWMGL